MKIIPEGQQKRGRKPERRARTRTEKLRDAREITKLRLRYHLWTQRDIVEDINKRFYSDRTPDANGKEPPLISQPQVSLEIAAFEAKLEAEAIGDIMTLRRIRIAELRECDRLISRL